jgi:hypothetical protein
MESSNLVKNFQGSATYQITVRGKVDTKFMNRLNNLSVSHTETDDLTLTTLTGTIQDQAALNGLLNILYDHQYSVISLQKIDG